MSNILLYSSLVENLRNLNGRRRGRDEEFRALQFISGALEKLKWWRNLMCLIVPEALFFCNKKRRVEFFFLQF